MERNHIYVLMAMAGMGLPAMAQSDDKEQTVFDNNYLDQTVDVGADVSVPLSESTASVSVITNKTVDKREPVISAIPSSDRVWACSLCARVVYMLHPTLPCMCVACRAFRVARLWCW